MDHHAMRHGSHGASRSPMWQAVFKGATHCGAGCALGDILAEGPAATMALTLFGSVLFGRLGLAFLLATVNHYGEARAWAWWRAARAAPWGPRSGCRAR